LVELKRHEGKKIDFYEGEKKNYITVKEKGVRLAEG